MIAQFCNSDKQPIDGLPGFQLSVRHFEAKEEKYALRVPLVIATGEDLEDSIRYVRFRSETSMEDMFFNCSDYIYLDLKEDISLPVESMLCFEDIVICVEVPS